MVVLIVAVGTVGGKLKNDFKVPGTDFQKATDLITAKFPAQKGDYLRVVLAAPAGQTLNTTERQDVIVNMLRLEPGGRAQAGHKPSDASLPSNPLAPKSQSLAKSGRIAFFDVQFDQQGFDLKRPTSSTSRISCRRPARAPSSTCSSRAALRTRRRSRACPTSSAWWWPSSS